MERAGCGVCARCVVMGAAWAQASRARGQLEGLYAGAGVVIRGQRAQRCGWEVLHYRANSGPTGGSATAATPT